MSFSYLPSTYFVRHKWRTRTRTRWSDWSNKSELTCTIVSFLHKIRVVRECFTISCYILLRSETPNATITTPQDVEKQNSRGDSYLLLNYLPSSSVFSTKTPPHHWNVKICMYLFISIAIRLYYCSLNPMTGRRGILGISPDFIFDTFLCVTAQSRRRIKWGGITRRVLNGMSPCTRSPRVKFQVN